MSNRNIFTDRRRERNGAATFFAGFTLILSICLGCALIEIDRLNDEVKAAHSMTEVTEETCAGE